MSHNDNRLRNNDRIYKSKRHILWLYYLIYWALHENEKDISFFGNLFKIQADYESMWKCYLFSIESIQKGYLFCQSGIHMEPSHIKLWRVHCISSPTTTLDIRAIKSENWYLVLFSARLWRKYLPEVHVQDSWSLNTMLLHFRVCGLELQPGFGQSLGSV